MRRLDHEVDLAAVANTYFRDGEVGIEGGAIAEENVLLMRWDLRGAVHEALEVGDLGRGSHRDGERGSKVLGGNHRAREHPVLAMPGWARWHGVRARDRTVCRWWVATPTIERT